MYRKAIKIDPKDPCSLYAHAVLLVALLAKEEHEQPKGGNARKKAERHQAHERRIAEVEHLVSTARSLDGNNRSYQWMESEFFLPATHRAWDPTIAKGMHVKSRKMIQTQSSSSAFATPRSSPTRSPSRTSGGRRSPGRTWQLRQRR